MSLPFQRILISLLHAARPVPPAKYMCHSFATLVCTNAYYCHISDVSPAYPAFIPIISFSKAQIRLPKGHLEGFCFPPLCSKRAFRVINCVCVWTSNRNPPFVFLPVAPTRGCLRCLLNTIFFLLWAAVSSAEMFSGARGSLLLLYVN